MVYKRYIKKGGKVYGPYSYSNHKEKGKVVTEYIGKESSVNKKKINSSSVIPFIGIILLVLFLSAIFFILKPTISGFATDDLKEDILYGKTGFDLSSNDTKYFEEKIKDKQAILKLKIIEQEGFENYINYTIKKINETRFEIRYKLNETLLKDINDCPETEKKKDDKCLDKVIEKYLKDEKNKTKIDSFKNSANNINDYSVNASSKTKINDKVDLSKDGVFNIDLSDYDKKNFSSFMGERIKVGYNTIIFEFYIEISSAVHLNSSRDFISDIYDSVKSNDSIWSETIKQNEYVRVSFETNLTNINDITIYARGNNSTIEVYEKDGTNLIATFPVINSENWSKIYLTNLTNSQDTFDLKVSADTEFDYIVDPTYSTSQAEPVAMAPLGSNKFVLGWCDEALKDIIFKIYDTNGTNLTGDITVDSSVYACDFNQLSISPFNSTTFVIGYADNDAEAATFAIYNSAGTQVVAPTVVDPAISFNSVVSVSALNSTAFAIGWWDKADGDATFAIYDSAGNLLAGPTDADTNVAASPSVSVSAFNSSTFVFSWFNGSNINLQIIDSAGNNLTGIINAVNVGANSYTVTSSTFNSSTFVLGWHDFVNDDITFKIFNSAGNNLTGEIDASDNVFTSYSASVSALNSTAFVIGWYDDVEFDKTFSVYTSNGTLMAGPIDSNTGITDNIYWQAVSSYVSSTNVGICNQNFIHAFPVNISGADWIAYYPNGTVWDGVCTEAGDNPPVSILSRPADNNVTDLGVVTFECNATDNYNLSNVTLYVWNSSGGIITTNFTSWTGITNSTTFNYNFTFYNSTKWNCLVYDNASQGVWALANRSLNISAPIIYSLQVTSPTTANLLNVNANENISVYFNFLQDSANITSGVTLNNLTIGGIQAPIITIVTGTPYSQDFEGVTFPPTGLLTGGDANWYRNTTDPDFGTAYAASGDILDSQKTWLNYSHTFSNPGNVSFFWNVSSEFGYDFACFCVDKACGDVDCSCSTAVGTADLRLTSSSDGVWTAQNASYYVNTTGNHTLTWCYAKDSSTSRGADMVKLDNIVISNQSSSVTQFTYVAGKGWEANVTVPSSLTGLQDLFVNATYSIYERTDTETGAINYSIAADTTAPNINFTNPTPSNASTITINSIFVNVSTIETSNHSTFIDFNRSLIGWWSMDSFNATGVYDNSTYGRFGNFTGGISTTNNIAGIRGKAFQFDGIDDSLTIGTGTDFSNACNDGCTITAWIKPDAIGTSQEIVSRSTTHDDGLSNRYFELKLLGNGRIQAYIYPNGVDDAIICGAPSEFGYTIDSTRWYFVALRYNQSEILSLIDNNFGGTAACTAINQTAWSSSSYPTFIGAGGTGTTYPYNGSIDEVTFFNRPLSNQELLALYNTSSYQYYNNFTNLSNANYNFTAYAIDSSGNVNKTETRIVTVNTGGDTTAPNINFTNPTPSNASTITINSIFVNVSTIETSNHSTFIDFNRSLIGWWSFDSYNTTGVYDNSTYGNFGTFQGGLSTSNILSGIRGKGMQFDGIGNYVNVPDSSLSGFTNGLTVSLWIKSTVDNDVPISDFSSQSGGYGIYTDNNWYTANGSAFLSVSAGRLTDNGWHMYTFIWNITNLTSYRDGNVLAVADGLGALFPSSSLSLGRDNRGGNNFNGSLDDVLIFSRALSSSEILSLYNASANQYYNNFTNLSNANYNFTAYAIDSSGNINKTETRIVTVSSGGSDITNPQINITYPTNNTNSTKTNLNVNYTASDTNLQSCWYSNDTMSANTSLTNCQTNITTIIWTEGQHNVTIWANDSAGNVNSSSVNFRIDTLAPYFTNLANQTLYNNQSLNYNIDATDDGVGLGSFAINWSDTFSIVSSTGVLTNSSALSVGNYYINVSVNDTLGNLNSSILLVNVSSTADTTAPNINFTNPTPSNASTITINSIYANVSTTDASDHSAFIDFNRDLMAWWSFDSVLTNGTIYDNSSWGNHGTLGNHATNTTTTGIRGDALQFDGTDDYIFFPTRQSLNLTTKTISLWVKPTSYSTYNVFYVDTSNIYVGFLADGTIRVNWDNSTGGDKNLLTSGATASPLDIWEFYTIVYNVSGMNVTVSLYRNATLLTSSSNSEGLLGAPIVRLGVNNFGSWRFNGTMDEVMIWNRTLSLQEIKSLYNASAYQYYNNFTNLPNANYNFTAYTIDSSGNVNKTEQRGVTVNYTAPDTTNPDMNITYPTNGTNSTKTNLNVNYTASDTNLQSCWYSNDTMTVNTSLTNCQTNITTIIWIEGQHNVTIWANDSVGNTNSSSVNFRIDSLAPYFTNLANQTLYNNQSLNYNIDATDDGVGLGSFAINWSGTFSIVASTGVLTNSSALSVGNYYINVSVNDTLGNLNSSVILINVSESDTTFPQISIVYPTNNTNSTKINLNINYTASDTNLQSCWYSNDSYSANTSLANCQTNITSVTWSQGQHNVTVWANDSAGNVNSSSVNFRIDSLPPYFTTFADQTIADNQTLNYDINAVDDGVGIQSFAINWTTNFSIVASTGVLSNSTSLSVGNYYINISVNDTLGNLNSSVLKITVTSTADTTAPYFTTIPENASLNYLQALDVNFNASDETAFGSYAVNDTRFTINSTGGLKNNTILGVALYIINVSITDSAGNSNSTIYQVNVSKIASQVSLTFDKTSPQSYPNSITPTCSIITGQGTPTLTNGTSATPITLGVGNWTFNCSLADAQNYTGSSNTTMFNITQNTTYVLSLAITPSTTVTYPTEITATGSGCPTELICNLSLNTTGIVDNPQIITLGVGVYNYTYNTTGNTNYSAKIISSILTISQNTSAVIYTYLNNSRSNITIYNNTAIWLNTTLSNVTGTISLYKNRTLINSGTSPLSNFTDFNGTGLYNITAIYSGNENYSRSFETWWVNVTAFIDSVNPDINIIYPINNFNSTNTNLDVNYTASDETALGSCWYSNDTMTVNTSLTNCQTNITTIIWAEGQHNVTIWVNDSSNRVNSSSVSFRIDTLAPYFTNLANQTETIGQSLNYNIDAIDDGVGIQSFAINWSDTFSIVSSTGVLTNSSALSIREYYINVSVNDTLGNLNSSILLVNVTAVSDITNPLISILSPLNTTYATTTILFNISSNENLSYCQFTINDWTTNYTIILNSSLTGANYTNSTMSQGSHTARFWCNDTTNNINNTEYVTFFIDSVSPSINLTYPINTSYNTNVSALNYTFEEVNPSLCWYSLNLGASNSTKVTCGTNWTGLTSNEGSNTWIVYINDTAGNTNSSSVTFFKDTIYSVISYGNGTLADGGTSKNNWIYVNVTVDEINEDTITFLLYNISGEVNSSSYTDKRRTINWTDLPDGTYYYNVSVNDTLSNKNTTITRTIILNTTLEINLIAPMNNSGDNDGNVSFVYSIDGMGNVSNCSLIFASSINQTNLTITKAENMNFYLNSLTRGKYNWSVNCTLTNNSIAYSEPKVFSVILTTYLSGETTNFSNLNVTNISNLVLQAPSYGKINFSATVNLENGTDIGDNVNVSFNKIVVNSTALPELNKTARLYFYGLTYSNPQPLKDGVVCSSCTEVSYSGGTFIYDVTGFSIYSSEETPVTPVTAPSGGGGSSYVAPSTFNITPNIFQRTIVLNRIEFGEIEIYNGDGEATFNLGVESIAGIISFTNSSIKLNAGEKKRISFKITPPSETGIYTGKIIVTSGAAKKEIPVLINVKTEKSLFDITLSISESMKTLNLGENLKMQVNLLQMGIKENMDVKLNYIIKDFSGKVYLTESETIAVFNQKSFNKEFDTNEFATGDYVVGVELIYPGGVAVASSQFAIIEKTEVEPRGLIIIILASIFVFVSSIIFLIIKRYKRIKNYIKNIKR